MPNPAKENDIMYFVAPRPTTKIIFVLLLASALSLLANTSQAKEEITIGLIPEMNVFAQMQRFQPLADYLSKEIGIDVQLSMLSRYGNIIDRLRAQQIDAAFLGSFTGALAISQLNVIPVVRPVNLDNTSTYHGHIFTRKDSGITKAGDMQGKTMAFVERATTAGYVFPLAWLKQNGINDHKTFFKEYFFAGSHDASIDAVLNGKADIGAAKNTIWDYYLSVTPGAEEKLIILADSPPVPSNGLCVMPSVSKETIAKLQTALQKLDKTPAGLIVLKKFRALKFVKTDVSDYKPVMGAAKDAGISLESYRYQNK